MLPAGGCLVKPRATLLLNLNHRDKVIPHGVLGAPVVVVDHLRLLLGPKPPLPRDPAERPEPLVPAHRVLPRDPAVVRALPVGAGQGQQEEPPHGEHLLVKVVAVKVSGQCR